MSMIIKKEDKKLHKIRRCSFEELVEILENIQDCQYGDTLKELKSSIEVFEASLKKLDEQVVDIALKIAKEVILSEVDKNSTDIVINLGNRVIKELKNSFLIRLNVNPKDYEAVLDYFGQLNYVEVVADKEIELGGIVAVSDTKKVDAQLSTRFKKAKEVIVGYKDK